MSTLLGIKAWDTGDIAGELKRAAVLCDKLVVKHVHAQGDCDAYPHVKADIAYLKELGIALEPPKLTYDIEKFPWLAEYDSNILEDPTLVVRCWIMEKLREPEVIQHETYARDLYESAADAYARVAASVLTEPDTADAVPLLSKPFQKCVGIPTRRSTVIRAVYDRVPMPDERTPWDAILDWRADPDARAALADLRLWVSRASDSTASVGAIKEEIEVCLNKYTKYMKVQHSKIPTGRFTAVCVGTLKVLEELPKIKLSPLLEAVFRPEAIEADLTEKELSAPGREVAFLARARDRFARPPGE